MIVVSDLKKMFSIIYIMYRNQSIFLGLLCLSSCGLESLCPLRIYKTDSFIYIYVVC